LDCSQVFFSLHRWPLIIWTLILMTFLGCLHFACEFGGQSDPEVFPRKRRTDRKWRHGDAYNQGLLYCLFIAVVTCCLLFPLDSNNKLQFTEKVKEDLMPAIHAGIQSRFGGDQSEHCHCPVLTCQCSSPC
jgi:hypothetical protein